MYDGRNRQSAGCCASPCHTCSCTHGVPRPTSGPDLSILGWSQTLTRGPKGSRSGCPQSRCRDAVYLTCRFPVATSSRGQKKDVTSSRQSRDKVELGRDAVVARSLCVRNGITRRSQPRPQQNQGVKTANEKQSKVNTPKTKHVFGSSRADARTLVAIF